MYNSSSLMSDLAENNLHVEYLSEKINSKYSSKMVYSEKKSA